MEPPVTYPESDKYRGQQIYGKKSSGCAKFGCFGIVGTIILIVLIAVIGYFFVFPALTPNSLKGDFLDVTVVPGKDGSPRLWVLTDGSFNFIQTTKRPGHYSTGRECYFCKLWLYNYDPAKNEILNKIKIERNDIITSSNILYRKGEVWVAAMQYGDSPPELYVFNSETGEQIMDTKGFISKHPELSSGISELYVDNKEPVNIRFKTKDGRENQILDFESGKLYDGQASFNDSKQSNDRGINTLFVINSRSGTARKSLYLISGPKDKVNKPSDFESTDLDNPNNLRHSEAKAVKLVPNKGFIEGLLLYQDKDACIILHQDVADKDSDRKLTCVDISGNVRWEIEQKDLFKKARVDKDDPFSSAFFMKDKFGAIVQSGIFVFKLEGSGVIGFDFKTGKKLWEIEF